MPANKVYIALLDSVTVPAGALMGAIESAKFDGSQRYGGEITWSIRNNGALGSACIILIQGSHNGQDWFDYDAVSSKDLSSGFLSSGMIPLRRGVMQVRALPYGNTTSNCNVTLGIQVTVSL